MRCVLIYSECHFGLCMHVSGLEAVRAPDCIVWGAQKGMTTLPNAAAAAVIPGNIAHLRHEERRVEGPRVRHDVRESQEVRERKAWSKRGWPWATVIAS